MVRRYDFGSPFFTDAVLQALPSSIEPLPYFSVRLETNGLMFSLSLDKDDFVFGLGETLHGINKRGHRYRSWNTDEFQHTEDRVSLYASHNFLLLFGQHKMFGAFFDDPGAITFDIGFSNPNQVSVASQNGDLSLYIIEEDTLIGIIRAFRQLIGQSYLPPKWAFGYLQSRWGYASDGQVRSIVKAHRDRHIPLDGVCLDIDYLEDYKDFTWNQQSFPDLAGLCADMRLEHIRLIPIIDAGIKEAADYDVCKEGLKKGYFCKREDGAPFVGAVWPGRSYFPDFLRDDVRAWFGDKYHALLAAGIEGFWNDMNEPALFYSEEGWAEAFRELDALRRINIGIEAFFRLKGVFADLANNPKDYERFYHDLHERRVRHDKVHNLYGAYMTRAAHEGMIAYDDSKRYLLFSRASYIGAHRYSGVWQGDNASWWSHLLLNLKMLPSLNMCGFLYTGADLGGFSCDTSDELLLRWLQLGVFTPLMRNHSSQHTREQEIYRFSLMENMRDTLSVRYALLPYLYSEYMRCALMDDCLFRPLAFDYPNDSNACRTEDQLMLGVDSMIAPVYEPNARGRYVYLPEDMLMIRFRSASDYDQIPMRQGHHWLELNTAEFPLFIRKGRFIPLSKGGEWVDAVDGSEFTLLGWLCGNASYALYDDDGYSSHVHYADGVTHIEVTTEGDELVARGDGLWLRTERLLID